jgi:hypothetical protein
MLRDLASSEKKTVCTFLVLAYPNEMALLSTRYTLHYCFFIFIEPWPIYIEDFQGRTHEVILTPGDMLFYESSKCFHGRPKVFNGSWYSSLFVHYYPKYGWFDQNHELEAHYAVPPRWAQQISSSPSSDQQQQQQQQVDTSSESSRPTKIPRLEMVGSSMREPDCPNEWCGSLDSVKWSGPGEEGKWISPTFERFPFEPQHMTWNEEL